MEEKESKKRSEVKRKKGGRWRQLTFLVTSYLIIPSAGILLRDRRSKVNEGWLLGQGTGIETRLWGLFHDVLFVSSHIFNWSCT